MNILKKAIDMPSTKKSPTNKKTNAKTNKAGKPNLLQRFVSKKRNITIVGLVLIFAVIGSYMAFQSKALTCTKPGYCLVSPQDCSGYTLMQGSAGTCVKVLQQSLNYYVSLTSDYHGQYIPVDGYFGSQTKAWVIFYQQRNHQTVDGIVGPQTWQNIYGNCWYSGQKSCSVYVRQ